MNGRRGTAARVIVAAGLALGAVVAAAGPAGAHGLGARADLPLPVWLFAYSAAFALLISFVALRLLWPRPLLAGAARGRAAPRSMARADSAGVVALGVVVAVLYVAALVAAWFGIDKAQLNLAPTALFIVFWVGMQIVSAVFGDVWRRANPRWLAAAALDRLRGRDPGTSSASGWWASHWPAAVGLFGFHWLELAYFEPASRTAVAVFLSLDLLVVLAGAFVFGAGWVRTGDGFAVLFSLLAALSPLTRRSEAAGGGLRLRVPGSGLATLPVGNGTLGVILVVLGGTTFDGVTRTAAWTDVVGVRRGWDLTAVHTVGLVATIAVVSVAYLAATRLAGVLAGDDASTGERARRWAPSLIPIVLAYSIAHYFSLLVFEGQNFVALVSDPLGRGWDLFGTAQNNIDFTVVSAEQIAYVQVAAIVTGHVAGVIAAHDHAVERYSHRIAVRSQYPLLALMVVYTVCGLLLLLNA